jgi:hypothetical protein
MDYHAFSNESLATMYFCIRGALAADDELNRLGAEPRFRVRETPAWKNMPPTWKRNCSDDKWPLNRSTGAAQKISMRPISEDDLLPAMRILRGLSMPDSDNFASV